MNNKIKKLLIAILIVLVAFLAIYFFKENSLKQEEIPISSGNVATIDEINSENNTENIVTNEKSLLAQKIEENGVLEEKGLPVLMYHFFYDKNVSKGKDNNWIEISKFEEQLKYLSENNFYYPTWQEVEDYIDGKIELPKKSVVLTFDDGDASFFDLAVPMLQKYNIPGTTFVITYWYGKRAENKEEGISYQSHSYDMHKAGSDGKGIMLSLDYDKIKEDVLLSREVLGGANIFCYPFGAYNENAIQVLKDTDYKLAFTTHEGRVKKGASKYELPRVRVTSDISLSEFKSRVK